MTNIIRFPGLQSALRRQLNEAVANRHYERAYEIFMEMEKYFELSDEEQVEKLEVLKELHAYLVLREESSILLNQGHPNYARIVTLFLQSLYELGQYRTVIELIDALKEESLDHQLIMQLLPLYDSAKHALNQKNRQANHQLRQFKALSTEEQLMHIVELIHEQNDQYVESVRYLLSNTALDAKVQSMMLEYLSFAKVDDWLTILKWGRETKVNPRTLSPANSRFMLELRPAILEWFELNEPSLVSAAADWLTLQNMLLFPVDLKGEAADSVVVNAYIIVISEMFGLEQPFTVDDQTDEIITFIKKMNENE